MKWLLVGFVVLILAAAAVLWWPGLGRSLATPPRPTLRILCGNSMAQPVQELGRLFTERTGIDLEYDLAGSEALLPKVLAGAPADVYVCHDPFEEKVRGGGRWAGSAVVGYLRPVLVVRPGNPKAIAALEDLTRPGLKIGIGDPRYSTCGQMFVDLLDRRGLREQVMAHAALQARTHVELANGLIVGPLDAAIVWNFIVPLYAGRLEVVPTDDTYEPVRVTVVGLTNSRQPALRDAFGEFCRGQEVLATFARYGYTGGPTATPTSRPASE